MFSHPFLIQSQNNIPLSRDYVIKKFFELGLYTQYNHGNNNYSCSCPICREGDTGVGNIKRCYYLPENDIIYCHRCGWSSKPRKWIKEVSGMTDKEIDQEILEDDYDYCNLDSSESIEVNNSDIDTSLPVGPIDLSNFFDYVYYIKNPSVKAVQHYLEQRRLISAINRPKSWFTTLKDNIHYGRLVIPYFDMQNKVTFYQSRDVTGKSDIRYLSKTHGIKSVFNINNIDYNKKYYYIFEGPFDSCFTKNGVAIGGITTGKSKFTGIQEEQLDKILGLDRIWVLDSQYLDEAAKEKSEILLNENESVFIWPKVIGEKVKDFNELAILKQVNEIPEKFIIDNTYSGMTGLLKLKSI